MNHIIEPKSKLGKSRGKLIFGSLVCLAIITSIFFNVKGCVSDVSPDVVNLALKKDGNVYLYSVLGSSLVEGKIAQNESPTAMAFLRVFKDEEAYFVEPERMKDLVAVFSDNYIIHNYTERSYEGYVTEKMGDAFDLSSKVESTETIGEQLYKYTVDLRNENGKKMNIRWSVNQKTWEKKAISNCEIHSFYKLTKPSPTESVYTNEDELVVNIADIAKFFGKGYSYDREAYVLYVEEK